MKNEKNSISRQRNSLLNFIKGCGCIGVVFIHILFPGVVGKIVYKASQYAVPIFLMISGYFAYNVNAGDKIKRRTTKICKITLFAILFYFIYTLCFVIKSQNVSNWLAYFLNWKSWVKIIIFSDLDIINGGHLWFLPAQIYAYLILLYIDKKNIYEYAYKSIPLLFALRIVVSVIVGSSGLTWHLKGNFFIGAVPWMFLGNYIAYNQNLVKKYSNKMLVGFALIGEFLAILFVVINFPIDFSEIGVIIYSIALFALAIRNPSIHISRKIEKIGDDYSLYIYIIHIAVGGILEMIVQFIGWNQFRIYLWIKPIVVVLISIVLSIFWCRVILKKKHRT